MNEGNEVTFKTGKISSLIAGICTVLFALFILLGFTTDTIMFQFLVCFVLAISYVVAANAVCSATSPEMKIWGRLTVSFAVMYAIFICFVYYTQLTVVRLNLISADSLALIKMSPGAWLFALDMLGYTFLALSTVFAAFLFSKKGLERKIRVMMIIHSVLGIPACLIPALPLFSGEQAVQSASFGGALALLGWCIVFAPVCFLLARYFSLNGAKKAQSV